MSDEEPTEYFTLLCDDPSHEVVLVDCGPREMDVVLAVRKVTGQSLWHSRVLARRAPVTLLGGLSADRAQSAVAVLRTRRSESGVEAGAQAREGHGTFALTGREAARKEQRKAPSRRRNRRQGASSYVLTS
ncbi:hypothetical protein, partial [Streptomyces mutabilis]|uniref:hypothetical protein n=1 Tax=Streptomyces mutabilis TaxID=67332 RepID=UPI003686F7B1